MKNLFLLSLLPTFLMTTAQAQDMSVSFDMSSVTTKTSDVKLYNFSPELINAAQNCTPYQEDFIKNNPDLGQNIPMLGGAKLAVNINILGYNEQGKCQFSVQQDITGLAKTTYNCLISPERQKDLINAMQDRSTTPITATFTTYSTIDYGDGRIEKQPLEQTMTDGKFNIVWAQTIAQDCQIKEEAPSAQEQQNLVEDMQTFSEAFLASLQKCQPASEEKQLFILTEKAEIIGGKLIVNGKETSCAVFNNDYYWVSASRRGDTSDSRFFGFVPETHVIGKVKMLIFSADPGRPIGHNLRQDRWLLPIGK